MISVLGGGAWGTALAVLLATDGTPVQLFVRRPELAISLNQQRENRLYLSGVPLPPSLEATADPTRLTKSPLWLLVPPAQHLRSTLAPLPLAHAPTLVLCSKGIEATTLQLMSEVAAGVAPGSPVAVLSGPSFAAEVARGLPVAVTLAAGNMELAEKLAGQLARPTFRPYASDDVIGCEIGGAVKNVLAIACGAVIGAGLGESARAAIIARGFAEMVRFGMARGARFETLTGLSGLGDLVLTCGSRQSRNMRLGVALGEGKSREEALAGLPTVAEGAETAPVLLGAAQQAGVSMPICEAVADLLAGRASIKEVVARFRRRPLRREAPF